IKTAVFSENAVLTSSEELVLCTGLAAKIDATIHSNFSNHTNKEDGSSLLLVLLLKKCMKLASTLTPMLWDMK
ncbi:hypothetical protein VP01_10248g2, partial [Puccinia sorghi]